MEHLRVRVEGWVDKSNWAFAYSDALFVDASQDTSHKRSGHRSTAFQEVLSLSNNCSVVAKSGDVRESTANAVIDATAGTKSPIETRVGFVWGIMVGEESKSSQYNEFGHLTERLTR